MPSRILRDGILTSPKVNQLSSGAELFYRRLMSVVDDYGRYHAHPTLLRAGTFPSKMDVVHDSHVTAWLAETIKVGLVQVYDVHGQKYLVMLNFGQKARSKSKFPAPCQQPASNLPADCQQPASNLPHVVVVEGVVEGVNTTMSDTSDAEAVESVPDKAVYPPGFVQFWAFFPRKIGKGSAFKAWKRLSREDKDAAIEQAEAYAQAYDLAPDARKQFFKHPATWLNARSWEDDHAEWALLIEGK